jgi:hypothetical protein
MKKILVAYLFVLLFCPVTAVTAEDNMDRDNRIKWENMSPPQRQEIQERYKKWKNLPREKKERLKESFRTFKNLSPEEKKKLKERFRIYQELDNTEKQLLRERVKKFENIPPETRGRLLKRYREMSERQRENLLRESLFWKGLDDNERKVFRRLYSPVKK